MNLTKSKSARLFAGFVGVAMALSFALPAGAQTTAELTAMINSLLAQIQALQAQIAAQGGSTGGAGVTFTSDLTVGSKGSEVTALQQWLVSKGYLSVPAGVAFGYFGNLTKSALAKYQAENGISPAAGYFGPITRARVNAIVVTPSVPTTPTTPGTGTGITTPGVEGTITATASTAGLASTAYEGDTMVGILGIKVEATNSDLVVQRIKLRVDETTNNTDTMFWNKIYKKLYVTDGTNVLASSDLNSSTVAKDGSNYYVTIAGFNLLVPKNGTKTIVIKADLHNAIDSADYSNEIYQLGLAANGVRAIDGAGIDQYAGGTSDNGIARTTTIASDLRESASLIVSLNTSSPKKGDLICAGSGTEDECDKLPVLVFDIKAEKDDVKITDINIQVDKTAAGGAVSSSTIYLFDGSTEVDSASVSGGDTGVFSSFDYVIPKNTTKTFTVKTDIRDADTTNATFVGVASSTGITAENSIGDSVSTKSGTATGYTLGIRKQGAEITLVSKSITTGNAPQNDGTTTNVSTSTLTATFNIKVKAVGGAVLFGTVASGTPMFASSTTSFKVYVNGAYDSAIGNTSTSTAFTIPTICTTSGQTGGNSCELAEGNEMTVPVTFQIYGRKTTGAASTLGLYAVGLEGIQWKTNGAVGNTTFMASESDWRTADVSFP